MDNFHEWSPYEEREALCVKQILVTFFNPVVWETRYSIDTGIDYSLGTIAGAGVTEGDVVSGYEYGVGR